MDLTDSKVLRISNLDPSVPAAEVAQSEFTVTFAPGNSVPVAGKTITLSAISYINVIPTIYDTGLKRNDTIAYLKAKADAKDATKLASDYTVVPATIRKGKYTVDELIVELNRTSWTALQADAEQKGKPANYWTFDAIRQRINFTHQKNIGVTFHSEFSPADVIGADPNLEWYVRPTALQHGDDDKKETVFLDSHPDMSADINSLFVYVRPELVEGIVDGSKSNYFGPLIAVIPIQGDRGQAIHTSLETANHPIVYHQDLKYVTVSVRDSEGFLIDFSRLPIVVELRIKTPILA